MSAHPKIFVSAVSKELREQRDLVAKTLRFLGFEPVVQNEFGTEQGNIREMLAVKIKPCCALIQLVGKALGSEVKDPQHPRDVMSYTHYEADYAVSEKKEVWYILIDDSWTIPLCDDQGRNLPYEDADAIDDQRAYRRRVKRSPNLYHTVNNDIDLEICILKMLHAVDKLRPQCTYWINSESDREGTIAQAQPVPVDLKPQMLEVLRTFFQGSPLLTQQSSQRSE